MRKYPIPLASRLLLVILALSLALPANAVQVADSSLNCPTVEAAVYGPSANQPTKIYAETARDDLYRRSDELVSEIAAANRDGRPVVQDFVIVGGGPHAVAFASVAKGVNPDARVLVFEATRYAGNFDRMGDTLWMFSPETRGVRGEARIKTATDSGNLMPGNTVQTQQFNPERVRYPSGEAFGWSHMVGHRANHHDIAFNQRVVSWEKTANGKPARYKVTTSYIDEAGQEQSLFVYTNVIADARGIGQPFPGVKDEDSLKLLGEEIKARETAEKAGKEYVALVENQISLSQRFVRDAENGLDPLARYHGKNVVVFGPTLGGQNVVEILAGAGGAGLYKASKLDSVDKINHLTWLSWDVKNIDDYRNRNAENRVFPKFKYILEGKDADKADSQPRILGGPDRYTMRSGYVTRYRTAYVDQQGTVLGIDGALDPGVIEGLKEQAHKGLLNRKIAIYTKTSDQPLIADVAVNATGWDLTKEPGLYEKIGKVKAVEKVESELPPHAGRPGGKQHVANRLVIDGVQEEIYEIGERGGIAVGRNATQEELSASTGNNFDLSSQRTAAFAKLLAAQLPASRKVVELGLPPRSPAWYTNRISLPSRAAGAPSTLAETELALREALQPELQRLRLPQGKRLELVVSPNGSLAAFGVAESSAREITRLIESDAALKSAFTNFIAANRRVENGVALSVPVQGDGRLALEHLRLGRAGALTRTLGEDVVRGERLLAESVMERTPIEVQRAIRAREARRGEEAAERATRLASEKSPEARARLWDEEERFRAVVVGQKKLDVRSAEGELELVRAEYELVQAELEHAAVQARREQEAAARSAELRRGNAAAARKTAAQAQVERAFADMQRAGHFSGDNLDTVLTDKEKSSLFDSLRARQLEEERLSALEADRSIRDLVYRHVAEGDPVLAEKMKKDLDDAFAGRAAGQATGEARTQAIRDALAERGWTPEQLERCGGICASQGLGARGPPAEPGARLVEDALLDKELAHSTDAAARREAAAIYPREEIKPAPGQTKVQALAGDLEAKLKGVEAERQRRESLATGKGTYSKEAKSLARAKAAEEHLRERLQILTSKRVFLEAKAPAPPADPALQSAAERAALDFLRKASDADLAGLHPSLKGLRTGAETGGDRLDDYMTFRRLVGSMDPMEKARVFEAVEKHALAWGRSASGLSKNPFEELALPGTNRVLMEKAFSGASELELAVGRADPELTRLALSREKIGEPRVALAEAIGAGSDAPARIERRTADAVAARDARRNAAAAAEEARALKAEGDRLAGREEPTPPASGRALASVPAGKEILNTAEEVASHLRTRLSGFDQAASEELIRSARVLEAGRSREKVDSLADLMRSTRSRSGDDFETMRLAYRFAADASAKGLGREAAIEQGIKDMLRASDFAEGEIEGMYRRLTACWKL